MERRQVILAARLRPMNPREISQGAKSCVVIDGACTTLVNPDSGNARAFVLDYSYDSSEPDEASGHYASNLTIFRDLGMPMLAKALEGVNTCLFTHGQSGSGKTYTMIGQENDPGLMPRMLESLFQQEAVRTHQITVHASFCEILNDQVRDILERDYYSPGGLKVRSAEGGGCLVEGLSRTRLASMLDCEELLAKVLRSLGTVPQGAHALFTVELALPDSPHHPAPHAAAGSPPSSSGARVRPPRVLSRLHLVDLAGSAAGAGAADTLAGALGERPRPTPQDKSLLAWANVMSALAENQLRAMQRAPGVKPKQVHVPFRGSVLTRILEDSMGGASQCAVIATLGPSHLAYKETLNTFRLIVRMKEVKKVARNDSLLNAYLGDPDFIPAAGGGWRWAYCAKLPDGSQE